jgi:hypothetical protein
MNLDGLASNAALAVLLACGLTLLLWLFLSLKKEIKALEFRCDAQQSLIARLATNTGGEMDTLRERLRDSEDRCGMLVPPPAIPSGMNLNKRSQAIRMLRLGDGPDRIAAALGLPVKEVELLAKIQKILVASV